MHKIDNWIILFIYWIFIIFISIKIIMKRRIVSSTILWLVTIYIVPPLGILIYLLFGELKIDKLREKRSKILYLKSTKILYKFINKKSINHFELKNSEVASSLFQFCEKRQCNIGISGVKNNEIKILNDTQKIMKKLIQDIETARYSINMIFYIWLPGGMADKVAISLIKASKRGVRCKLILDSAGSVNFFRSNWFKLMCTAGIEIVESLKINLIYIFLRRMDLRQHRKIILIDNYIAYTGSMNLIDPRYFKQHIGIGEWIDLMVRIKGSVAINLGIIFSRDWAMETGKYILPLPQTEKNFFLKKDKNIQYIQTIASGPGFPKNIINQALLIAIYSAKKKIIITTPYFVPSDDLLHAICNASYKGVDVSLIVPMYNDSILVSWASRAFFDELLESGVKIYQFYGGLLHTKSLLIDDQLSMIGTVNFDVRSLSINFELILFIDSRNFSKKLSYIQNNYIAKSKLLDKKVWSRRAWQKKVIEKVIYFFSPFL